MNQDEWWKCDELTLQGNLTIAGFSQKIWHAKPSVCAIHVNVKSGMARIDWNEASVVVSPAVIQHGTLAKAVESSTPPQETPPSRTDELLAALEPDTTQDPSALPPTRRRRKAKAD